MCQLLGMNANTPTDVMFSFTGLATRADEHKDGFGIAFFEDRGLRHFIDRDGATCSPVAEMIKRYPIKSEVVIAHIRKATVGAVAFALVGMYAPASFLAHFTVFVLACFIGYMVVWNVTPSLHTPLMSVTNAISSIIAIGALVQVAPPLDAAGAADRPNTLILGLAVFALALTAVNMFGGFAVTRRMLAMFRK